MQISVPVHIILKGFTETETNHIDRRARLYDECFSFSMCTLQYLCKCTTIFANTIFDPCYLCFFAVVRALLFRAQTKLKSCLQRIRTRAGCRCYSHTQQQDFNFFFRNVQKQQSLERNVYFSYWFADSFIYTRKGIRQNSNLSIILKILILFHMNFEHC